MERIEANISILNHVLNNRKKRYIAGSILMGISLLFGGLSVTVLTLRCEKVLDEKEDEYEQKYIE